MQKVYSKGFSGWAQLAILLGLVGVGIIIGAFASIPVWQLMTHGNILDMEKDMLNPENASALQVVQFVSVLFMFFIPTIAYAFICYRNGWAFLGFTKKLNPQHLLVVLLIVICSIPFISFLEEINKAIPISAGLKAKFDALEKKYNEQVLLIAQVKTWGQYFISLLIIAVLPAITEEMLFRGGLQNLLTRWIKSPWPGIIITGFLFSIIHLSWYGFFARFFLGIVLGLIFYYTQNIWLNILAHFINNAMVVTIMFITYKQGKVVDMAASEHVSLWISTISLIFIILLIRWLSKISTQPIFDRDDTTYFDSNNPFDHRNNYP